MSSAIIWGLSLGSVGAIVGTTMYYAFREKAAPENIDIRRHASKCGAQAANARMRETFGTEWNFAACEQALTHLRDDAIRDGFPSAPLSNWYEDGYRRKLTDMQLRHEARLVRRERALEAGDPRSSQQILEALTANVSESMPRLNNANNFIGINAEDATPIGNERVVRYGQVRINPDAVDRMLAHIREPSALSRLRNRVSEDGSVTVNIRNSFALDDAPEPQQTVQEILEAHRNRLRDAPRRQEITFETDTITVTGQDGVTTRRAVRGHQPAPMNTAEELLETLVEFSRHGELGNGPTGFIYPWQTEVYVEPQSQGARLTIAIAGGQATYQVGISAATLDAYLTIFHGNSFCAMEWAAVRYMVDEQGWILGRPAMDNLRNVMSESGGFATGGPVGRSSLSNNEVAALINQAGPHVWYENTTRGPRVSLNVPNPQQIAKEVVRKKSPRIPRSMQKRGDDK